MDSLSGILLVPPERGQILGRAVWKARYVVVGRRNSIREQPVVSYPHRAAPSRTFSNSSKMREPLQLQNTEYTISVYKSKDDYEPYYQCPVNSVTDCQVQQLSHRKQGPVLPTLVITVSDKEKKRRSSRAAGLISGKESTQSTLWFRTPPDDHHHSLHEWRHYILSRKLPMSPESPVSPTFVNPFAPRSDGRPSSGNQKRTTLSHLSHSRGYAAPGDRDGPPTAHGSESPSLRSKRSDVSSPTSGIHPSLSHRTLPSHHHYAAGSRADIPPDLPSPAESGAGDQHINELIDGWSSPQARSSSFSSPRAGAPSLDRRHTSVGVSPTINRETILDRAFQLRCIPGSERAVPGEEKLSSLARFDALMRDTEDRRNKDDGVRAKQAQEARRKWEMGGDSSESDDDSERETDDEDDDYHLEQDSRRPRRDTLIPPATQRALEFITGRYDGPQSPRTPHSAALPTTKSAVAIEAPFRPHTSYARKRPDMASRTQSQPHLLHNQAEVLMPPIEDPAEADDRQGSNNGKRPSFAEFTKRLSSTSSLLLVQTNNTSGASSRGSSELDYHPVPPLPRSSLGARSSATIPNLRQPRDVDERDKRCAWRSSVGVIGGPEGGFV